MDEQRLLTYDEFERDWLRKHRSSIPRKRRVSPARSWFWVLFWIVVATGAAVYSAAHTIPAAEMTISQDVPNRSRLALSVFAIVELVIFGAAAKRHDVPWMRYVMAGAVLVALVSNTGSSVLAVSQNGGNALNQIAGILLSIIAPLTALAAGEVLHLEQNKRDAARQEANAEYQAAMVELQAKVNAAWKRYEKDSRAYSHDTTPDGQRRVSVRSDADSLTDSQAVSVSGVRSDSRQRAAAYGYDTTPDGQRRVIAYLEQNPDHARLGSRQLGELVGVSHDTANKGRKAWQEQRLTAQQETHEAALSPQFSTNGHMHKEAN